MAMRIALDPINRVPAVAGYLDCDTGTVYSLIQSGDLRAVRLGRNLRVTREAVEEFLAGGGHYQPGKQSESDGT